MKRFAFTLSCLLFFLLLPACGAEDPEANCPFLDSHPDTALSDDVLLSFSAYGTAMDSFYLQMDFRNLSEIPYCLEDLYYFEKKVEGKWVSMPQRTSINGISIGQDTSLHFLPPGQVYHSGCMPFYSTEEALEPGVEYRVLTRLYPYENPSPDGSGPPDSYILLMAEFSYPAYALEWTDTLFPSGEDYLPMTVTPEQDILGHYSLEADYCLSENGSDTCVLDERLYIERLENGLNWKTAPLFQNESMITVGYATSSHCSITLSPAYALEPGVPYRLILQLDYRYADAEAPVLTASFCGPFTIADESAPRN